MSMIKTHLHEQESMIEILLPLKDVEYLISYLEETDDSYDNAIADDLRTQTYASL